MTERKAANGEIDWSTAQVSDGALVVELGGEPTASWAKHVGEVIERLDRAAGRWGKIECSQKRIKVGEVGAGSEADLRHFLESVVQQANADYAPEPEPEGDDDADGGSEADREMTAAFRGFADEGASEDSGD